MVFSDGSYEKVLTAITEILEKRRQLNVSECSIDAKFIGSKKVLIRASEARSLEVFTQMLNE